MRINKHFFVSLGETATATTDSTAEDGATTAAISTPAAVQKATTTAPATEEDKKDAPVVA